MTQEIDASDDDPLEHIDMLTAGSVYTIECLDCGHRHVATTNSLRRDPNCDDCGAELIRGVNDGD